MSGTAYTAERGPIDGARLRIAGGAHPPDLIGVYAATTAGAGWHLYTMAPGGGAAIYLGFSACPIADAAPRRRPRGRRRAGRCPNLR